MSRLRPIPPRPASDFGESTPRAQKATGWPIDERSPLADEVGLPAAWVNQFGAGIDHWKPGSLPREDESRLTATPLRFTNPSQQQAGYKRARADGAARASLCARMFAPSSGTTKLTSARSWWRLSIAQGGACRHAAVGHREKKPARCVADAGKDWTMADHPVKVVGMIDATLGEAAAIVYWTSWRVL